MRAAIGVVGLGVMGRTHLRVLGSLPATTVVAVADVEPSAMAHVREIDTYRDPLALVREADVDAVLVASSDESHAALVLACLERGLPVLCEKPLTTSVADAQRIVAAEAAIGRRLVQVGFMRRFDQAFVAVADAVSDGRVGAPGVVHTVHRNPVSSYAFTPHVLVTNSASHDVDLVRWITGDEAVEAACQVASGADAQFASVLLRLTMRSGALASTELTYGPGCGYDVGCTVVGRLGSASTPADQPAEGDWVSRFADAYHRQDMAWVESLGSGLAVGASAWDGLANVLVLDAAGRALATGSPVAVELPTRPDIYTGQPL